METPFPALALWGKRGPSSPASGEGVGRWHPLACHLLDVAAVAGELWDDCIGTAMRRGVTAGLGMADEGITRTWVVFLAALHDLGKASPTFQAKDDTGATADRLRAVGVEWPAWIGEGAPHGVVTVLALQPLLVTHGVPEASARELASAVGGHHGGIASSRELQDARRRPAASGSPAWHALRATLFHRVRELMRVPTWQGELEVHSDCATILAGLVSVADWLGSAEEYFPYEATDPAAVPPLDLVEYTGRARDRARRALDGLGWQRWSAPGPGRDFADVFGFSPRPVQQEVDRQSAACAPPCISVLEVPTGEGKTEAALLVADRLMQTHGTRGFYLAMPTQATSNQMFERTHKFLSERFVDAQARLILLHGHATIDAQVRLLSEGRERTLQPSNVFDDDCGRSGGVSLASEWFGYRKRGLLAPFGVGTIDQALLAVLHTRHGFVRLFGLANRVVVFDEVHAYDTYVSTLLERLLRWLGAMGTSVVILSATLPRSRTEGLLSAFGEGAGLPARAPTSSAPYPRVTWLDRTRHVSMSVGTSARSQKTVRLTWGAEPCCGDGSLGEGFQRLLAERLRDGGCVAVICNTVHRAQGLYSALLQAGATGAIPGDTELGLFHARYPQEDRARRERLCLAQYGKPPSPQRPRRAILVATQVVEQSLDLDFDLLVTDIAPVDLVLQRVGRLHRHERPRPLRLTEPEVCIVGVAEAVEMPSWDRSHEWVYDRYVLLRTWLALHGETAVHVPEDVERLVETVYGTEQLPSGATLSAAWIAMLAEARCRLDEQVRKEEGEALQRCIRNPTQALQDVFSTDAMLEEDAPELHRAFQAVTRLSGPSASVVCLYGTPDRPTLDLAGREPVDVSVAPPPGAVRGCLERTMNVSHGAVARQLLELDVPSGWRRSATLRRHRALLRSNDGTLTALDGSAPVHGVCLRLDLDLGLVIEGRAPPRDAE